MDGYTTVWTQEKNCLLLQLSKNGFQYGHQILVLLKIISLQVWEMLLHTLLNHPAVGGLFNSYPVFIVINCPPPHMAISHGIDYYAWTIVDRYLIGILIDSNA